MPQAKESADKSAPEVGPPSEPIAKRAIAFVDGQNLYGAAKEAFSYHWPNYDVKALARQICKEQAWELKQVRFYTGVPPEDKDWRWHGWWAKKLAMWRRAGIEVYSRHLRYRPEDVEIRKGTKINLASGANFILPEDGKLTVEVAREKGIDVRLAIDVVRLALSKAYDVVLIFSQDQDLSEVVDEVKSISRRDKRWIRVACAYPVSPASENTRGINGADWIEIDRHTYDLCLDNRDFRPSHRPSSTRRYPSSRHRRPSG